MARKTLLMTVAIHGACRYCASRQRNQTSVAPGRWIARAVSVFPANMNQTLTITQTDDQIELETKLIQPNNERISERHLHARRQGV